MVDKIRVFIKFLIVMVLALFFILLFSVYFFISGSDEDVVSEGVKVTNATCFALLNGETICPGNETVGESNLIEINSTLISQILYGLRIDKLHNPPLSDSTPKIEILLASDFFNSEVISHEIFTEKGFVEDEDIQISMSPSVVIDIVSALSIETGVMDAVDEGLIGIRPQADYPTLLSKGYYGIYKKFEKGSDSGTPSEGVDYSPDDEFIKLEFVD